jgi:CubicO group peptidase (beta-lactamase class C family)
VPDAADTCPEVLYEPSFDWLRCAPTDQDPSNDAEFECRSRERVIQTLLSSGVFVTHIAFAVVRDGRVHFADAFSYVGLGQYVHDPAGIHRLYRVGSTTKAITASTAKILEENGVLSLGDYVEDEDATQQPPPGDRTLRQLLAHLGAFKIDSGVRLFCYPGDLAAFWAEPDDLVSPQYDSAVYGNLGGGYQYSAFNYSLAGAYLAHAAGGPFAEILQTRVFDAAGMCTAMLDGTRAAGTPIGADPGVSQAAVMHVGPWINFVAPTDPLCMDNYYSSDALPGDPYTWLYYHLDEAGAEARDPAGGVIASVIDMAHFAGSLLDSYHERGGLLSPAGVRDLWTGVTDLGCSPNCPYEPYYGMGFFTDTPSGPTISQVGHGGSRAGFSSAFVLRPEADVAVCVLANADVSTMALSNLAKTILDDAESTVDVATDEGPAIGQDPGLTASPNPVARRGTVTVDFFLTASAGVRLRVYDVRGSLLAELRDVPTTPGRHRVDWTPAHDGVGPGVYFVRMTSRGASATRKIVVSR